MGLLLFRSCQEKIVQMPRYERPQADLMRNLSPVIVRKVDIPQAIG